MYDIMKWRQIARNREGIPGQESSGQPAAQTAPASPPPQEVSELDQLADLRDKGILTEEEYQAKKEQLESG
jgi:hypothetical protein